MAHHEQGKAVKADNSLFPRLPLYAGVLITAVDVLIVLAFFNSSKGRQGMLLFEILITSLVRSRPPSPPVLRLRRNAPTALAIMKLVGERPADTDRSWQSL